MARRRELKCIASGLAAFCISRNNDIAGYWAVGVVYNVAIHRGVSRILVSAGAEGQIHEEVFSLQRNFEERFAALHHPLLQFVSGWSLEFQFDPLGEPSRRGQRARVTCLVQIIDDLGISRKGKAVTYCFPHDPGLEYRSIRA